MWIHYHYNTVTTTTAAAIDAVNFWTQDVPSRYEGRFLLLLLSLFKNA